MDDNIYDSLTFHTWDILNNKANPRSEQDVPKKYTVGFALKYNKLNEDFLKYFRKFIIKNPESFPGLSGLKIKSQGHYPDNEYIELLVLSHVKELLIAVSKRFTTSLEHDLSTFSSVTNLRVKFAMVHRMSQKRIFKSQVALTEELLRIMRRVIAGDSITDAHLSQEVDRLERVKQMYPLRNYLKRFNQLRQKIKKASLIVDTPSLSPSIKPLVNEPERPKGDLNPPANQIKEIELETSEENELETPTTTDLEKPNESELETPLTTDLEKPDEDVPPPCLDKNERYLNWLQDNGCIFPRVEYPAKFGEFEVIGAKAKYDIPPSKAFLFVAHSCIITCKKAKNSEIGFIIGKHKHLFRDHEESEDLIIYIFIMYEKLKGHRSFWHPYLEIVDGMDLVMFWSEQELDALQDVFLKNQAKKMLKTYQQFWKEVYKVVKNYPGFFPGSDEELEKVFRWSYELVIGRSFGWSLPCSMIVPLADNLNHANVNVTYQLIHKKIHLVELSDKYADFSNVVETESFDMPYRSYQNRLEKRINNGEIDIENVENIWDIDTILND